MYESSVLNSVIKDHKLCFVICKHELESNISKYHLTFLSISEFPVKGMSKRLIELVISQIFLEFKDYDYYLYNILYNIIANGHQSNFT